MTRMRACLPAAANPAATALTPAVPPAALDDAAVWSPVEPAMPTMVMTAMAMEAMAMDAMVPMSVATADLLDW